MSNTYYPSLSSVVSLEQIPEQLNFISEGINGLLDKIYYKDFIVDRSLNGASVSYRIDIVSYSEILKLEIPGTGLVLLLNPDLENPNVDYSIIPVSLTWEWGIKQYIRNFKTSGFSFQPQAFYDLIFKIATVQDDRLLLAAVDAFINNNNPLDKFAVDANTKYSGLNIPLPLNSDEEIAVNQILIAIEIYPDATLYEILLQDYIVASSLDESLENINLLFFPLIGYDAIGSIKDLFIPKLSASLQLSAGLEIPRSVLKPIKVNGEVELDENIKTVLLFEAGELFFSTQGGFGFNETLALSFPVSHPKAQIGNTGIIIGFTYAKLDVSPTSNIPEADAAGYPVDFVGLYVQQATIEFNRFGQNDNNNPSATIFAQDLLIGTGGVSGTIGLEANGSLYRKFGENFAAQLDVFSITFRQGEIINSSISGFLTIPKFTSATGAATIAIQANIFANGDFSITALPLLEPYEIILPNVFKFAVRSLTLGKSGERYFIQVAGVLDFIADLPILGQVLPKNLEIYKLIIWDDGDLEFEGGNIKLPLSFRLKVGPVSLEVNNVSIGGYTKELPGDLDVATGKPKQLKYRYFSFDGMINTGRAGVNANGNGIKYYFSTNHQELGKPFDHFVGIDSIAIDISIPGNVPEEDAAFLLDGYLSMRNPTVGNSVAASEYTGSVTFSLPKLRLSGSAGMNLKPSIPAFIVDIGMELPVPIPIGATGLGIFGFRGIIGQHYVPDREAAGLSENATWWEYYKAKGQISQKEGIEITKFASKPGFSVGAGASIATVVDGGKIFSGFE